MSVCSICWCAETDYDDKVTFKRKKTAKKTNSQRKKNTLNQQREQPKQHHQQYKLGSTNQHIMHNLACVWNDGDDDEKKWKKVRRE